VVLLVVAIYCLLLVAACWLYRPSRSYGDFVVAKKSSGWAMTASGLFTLIGGGELVAGTSFGFAYGWYGVSLFIGYGVAFLLLAILTERVRRATSEEAISYVEYAAHNYGPLAGDIVLAVQFLAFFALLVLQLLAGGTILSALTPLNYPGAVIFCSLVVGAYLLTGGFRAVMLTDAIQAGVMLLLGTVIAYVATTATVPTDAAVQFDTPVFDVSWGVALSGVIIGLASADVWQRILAARSAASARNGLVVGGLSLTAYGCAIVYLGILARTTGITSQADTAFLDILNAHLPTPILNLAVLASVAAILSTADTEVFLLSSLLERRFAPRSSLADESNAHPFQKQYLVGVLGAGALAAFWASDLATFFNWMFVAYMAVAPTVAFSLFLKPGAAGFLVSIAASVVFFVFLLLSSVLTLENAYFLAAPALAIVPAFALREYLNGDQPPRIVGQGPKSLTYLFYAGVVWFSVYSEVSTLALSLPRWDTTSSVVAASHLPLAQEAASDSSLCNPDTGSCNDQASYGMFFALRNSLPKDPEYARAIFTGISLFLFAHALRVFLGAYFVKNDRSFVIAKKEWLGTLSKRQRSMSLALEHVLVLSHIFLLGLLAYKIKGDSPTDAVWIIVFQGVLFLVADVLYWRPLWLNKERYESFLIVFVDVLTLMAALALLMLLVHGISTVPGIALFGGTLLLFVLFIAEFFFAYSRPLAAALKETGYLLLACVGIVVLDDEH
jgi:SSS family solute:Na+ symporter